MFPKIASRLGYAGIACGLASLVFFGILGNGLGEPAQPGIWAMAVMIAMGVGYALLAIHAWRQDEGGPAILYGGFFLLLALMASHVALESVFETVAFIDTMRFAWTVVIMAGIGLCFGSRFRRVPFPVTR